MTTTEAALAAAILQARADGRRRALPAAPDSHAAAYRVQAMVDAALGPVGGFKTALKPPAPQIMAPIHAATLQPSGGTAQSPFGGGLGVELEVGLRLLRPLPPLDAPDFAVRLRDCVEPVAVIELVDTRLEGAGADAPLAKLADNQINAGLVVGAAAPGWAGGPLDRVTARMTLNGAPLLDGPAEVPGGDAVDSLAALARMIGDHCGGLQPGQIVITGSLHPLTYVDPGTDVSGEIDGIGGVSVRIL